MRQRSIRWTLFAAVLAALALVVSACGGDDNNSGSSNTNSSNPTEQGKKGGTLTYLAASDIDYLDPGQTYYTFGSMVAYATNRPLYSFKPDNSQTPIPDLADGDPQISADNKTITVKIKPGIKFAPPVNREVTTADIKYAIERAFTKQVPSGYAGTYFSSIVGTPAKSNTGSYKPISGLQTPDKSTLVIKLKTASAPLVSQALVMPITIPVPKSYAFKYDQKNPSTYDSYVAFTGPYMVKNNSSGKVVGRVPGKQIQIVRNPNWDAKTDYRPAYLDAVNIDEGNSDLTVASRRTLQGNATLCCDAGSPPAPVLKQALSRNKDQVIFVPSGGTRYIGINNTIKPFDNLNVRKALIAGTDRSALRLTRGGATLGDIATGWIPPGIPGFEEAGGLKQNTDLDYFSKPEGDQALFKKYMLAAKQEDPASSTEHGQVDRLGEVPDHRDQRGPRQEDRRGHAGPAGEHGLQAQLPHRAPGHALHEVLRRAQDQGRDLPERRVVQGLHRPAVHAGRHVQRQQHPPAGQRQLAAAQRQGDQRRDGEGRARARRQEPERRVGEDQPPDRRAGAVDPVDLGQDGPDQLQGRERRGE